MHAGYLPDSGPLDFRLVIQVLFGPRMIFNACARIPDLGLTSNPNDAKFIHFNLANEGSPCGSTSSLHVVSTVALYEPDLCVPTSSGLPTPQFVVTGDDDTVRPLELSVCFGVCGFEELAANKDGRHFCCLN